MSRRGVSSLPVCAVMVVALSATAGAQRGRTNGALYDAAFPGGVRAAVAALHDPVTPDPGQFLLELIRRFHHVATTGIEDARLKDLQSVLSGLEGARTGTGSASGPDTRVPLPLPPALWIDAVFAGRATPDTLVAAILRSREASLLYAGLLSLDDGTRAWLAERPELVRYLVSGHAARFLVAAPGLRVRDGRLRWPGGDAANPAWEALAGPANGPEDLIRAILEHRSGTLAYTIGSLAPLTQAQLSFVLDLNEPPEQRTETLRRVHAAFAHAADRWKIDEQPFWRPALDPALLASELPEGAAGMPLIPGNRGFWSQVFSASVSRDTSNAPRRDAKGAADFGWLCGLVFTGPPVEQRDRSYTVLFAARLLPQGTSERDAAAVDAVRASRRYPALTSALERAGLTDVRAYAAAARRAAALSAIGNESRAKAAFVQYQGALALIIRGALRRQLPADSLSHLVSSLSAVNLGDHGEYEGRLVRWIDAHLARLAPADGPIEQRMVNWLSGSSIAPPAIVEWEGTRYRVDPVFAEATRLTRLLGGQPRPFMTSARDLVEMADILDRQPSGEQLRSLAGRVPAIVGALGDVLPQGDARALHDLEASLQRMARLSDSTRAPRVASGMRRLADHFLMRSLLEFTYATAFGQPGTSAISVDEAAARHDFGPPTRGRLAAWQLPEAGVWPDRDWQVTGALLGLDVKLAEFLLVRISSRPPARRPTVNGVDRRVFIEAVGLLQPSALTDTLRDDLLAALARGRALLGHVQASSEVAPLADQIELSPARRALLEWTVTRAPGRVQAFLSLTELLWLGLGPDRDRDGFDGWGSPGQPRLGCLCLQVAGHLPWDRLAGRWSTGMLASGFPDLNLRLTELLAELNMPAALLPYVLAPATLDFVENAERRDQDDRRGLLEYVRALGRERAEQYLALLTTDGPLVPIGDATGIASRVRKPQ